MQVCKLSKLTACSASEMHRQMNETRLKKKKKTVAEYGHDVAVRLKDSILCGRYRNKNMNSLLTISFCTRDVQASPCMQV